MARQVAVEPWNAELLANLAAKLERAGRGAEAAERRAEAASAPRRMFVALLADVLKGSASSKELTERLRAHARRKTGGGVELLSAVLSPGEVVMAKLNSFKTKKARKEYWRSMFHDVYDDRQSRRTHPEGEFDRAGRWYPSDRENGDGSVTQVRSPSRTWPYSYMKRARSRGHVTHLFEQALEGRPVPPDVDWEMRLQANVVLKEVWPRTRRRRYNPDERTRRLERAAAQGDWDAKLALNFALLREDRVPPPDVDIVIRWTPESIAEFRQEMHHYPDAVWRWTPQPGDVKERWRRWYFPNGFGVSAHFDEDNPDPGMAPIPVAVARKEHRMDAPPFRWLESPRVPVEDSYPSALRRKATVEAWPPSGAPRPEDAAWNVSPRPLRHGDAELLEIMRIAAGADYSKPNRALWDGTPWDWWTEEGVFQENPRRNPDAGDRGLERRALAGDDQAAAALYASMRRSPRPDLEWSRLSLRLMEQAGGLINEDAAVFKRLRREMRGLAPRRSTRVREPDRDVYQWSSSEATDLGHWLDSSPFADHHAWAHVEAWTARFHRLVWVSTRLLGIITWTEGDVTLELFNSTEDWQAGLRRAAEFYGTPPLTIGDMGPRPNPDERSRELERRAALGDERARRQLCYERIRDRPRRLYTSVWDGDLWVGCDPDRISGQDVALWWWTPHDGHPGFYIWGVHGSIEVGPDWDNTTEVPANPLYERLRATWHEPKATTMEDVWRKPWPWDAERKWKVTEGADDDAYWERVFAFESDLRDALDLSWCLEPGWWAREEVAL